MGIDQLISLLDDAKITRVNAAAAAATTDLDGTTVLDTSADGGYDAVMFIGLLGDVLTTCVLSIEGRESDNADGSNSNLITGSKSADFTADATSADNKVLVTDIVRRTKRYVFPRIHRGTANAVVDGVVAIQYKSKNKPISQPATVISSIKSAA